MREINNNKRTQEPYFHHHQHCACDTLLLKFTYSRCDILLYVLFACTDGDDKNDDEINIMQHMGQICG
jgi:hypothetical protein